MGLVYLIHLDVPYKHSSHYIGYVEHNLHLRLKKHRNGSGSKFLRAVNLAGIEYGVVKLWADKGRDFERYLKNYKKSSYFCPQCKLNREKKKQCVAEE